MGLEKLPSLLSVKQVKNLLKAENLAAFDKHFRLIEANPGEEFREKYKSGHIPRALFFSTMQCAQPSKLYPRALPDKECFRSFAGSLGISNKHHLIIYDRSPFGFFASSRLWSVFRLFGHENLSILDGGINLWKQQQGQITNEEPNYKKEAFEVKENPKFARTFEQIEANIKSRREQVVDVRGSAEFNKVIDGVENKIPNSLNLPYDELFDNINGTLKSKESLKELIESHKVDLSKPNIASCTAGMTSCTLAFVAHLLNNSTVPVYYGSWTEYSQRRKLK